jgi:hypothetical protein
MLVRPHMRMSSFLSLFVIIGMVLSALNACSQEQSSSPIKIGAIGFMTVNPSHLQKRA